MPNFVDCVIHAKNWLVSIPANVWGEIIIRLILLAAFLAMEFVSIPPFERIIQPEEAWLYKFPTAKASIVSGKALSVSPPPTISTIVIQIFTPWLMITSSLAVILISYGINRKLVPGLIALLVPSLAIPLTGLITNVVKITVGRPRPDYYSRCYGPSYMTVKDLHKKCTGNPVRVLDGRKSFPSGHSSLSFCALGFISVYLASQLQAFVVKGSSWRLILSFLPLGAATLVAISRTVDYHHHYSDVIVGAILGFSVMYVIYLQYFPPLTSHNCQTPYDFYGGAGVKHQGHADQQYDSLEMSVASTTSSANSERETSSSPAPANNAPHNAQWSV